MNKMRMAFLSYNGRRENDDDKYRWTWIIGFANFRASSTRTYGQRKYARAAAYRVAKLLGYEVVE